MRGGEQFAPCSSWLLTELPQPGNVCDTGFSSRLLQLQRGQLLTLLHRQPTCAILPPADGTAAAASARHALNLWRQQAWHAAQHAAVAKEWEGEHCSRWRWTLLKQMSSGA